MKKNNSYYFKKALLLIIPIIVFIIVKGLFEIGISDFSAVLKLLAKAIFVGVFTSVILGIFNMFVKIDTFMKKE